MDGSGRRDLPRELQPWGFLGDRHLFLVILGDPNGPDSATIPIAVAYDLASGTMAGLGRRWPGVGGVVKPVAMSDFSSAPTTTPHWDPAQLSSVCHERTGCVLDSHGEGEELAVVNLLAVTR